jgi:hypothetical protein
MVEYQEVPRDEAECLHVGGSWELRRLSLVYSLCRSRNEAAGKKQIGRDGPFG